MGSGFDRQDRRDFDHPSEPAPPERPRGSHPLGFVVHLHAARRPHYDLRLELGGMLKSWTVPKGFSLDPKERRLAVMAEDRTLDYAFFEGKIPEGQQDAGAAIVWDNGIYSPDEKGELLFHDPGEAEERVWRGLAEGQLSLFFWGSKLAGSWSLVRMSRGEDYWRLTKGRDEFARHGGDLLADDRSVLSGLTVEEIQAGARPYLSRRGSEPGRRSGGEPPAAPSPFPTSVKPMLASRAEAPFSHPDWLFEPILNGARTIAQVRDGRVRLLSRRGLDATPQYPAIADLLARQPQEMVLDGEIVALDEEGRPSRERPQGRSTPAEERESRTEAEATVVYYVFDLLYLDGYDLRSMPLEQRKAVLGSVLLPSDRIRVLDHLDEEGEVAFEAALSRGLEGIVAKRRDSSYESGRRSRNWLAVEEKRRRRSAA